MMFKIHTHGKEIRDEKFHVGCIVSVIRNKGDNHFDVCYEKHKETCLWKNDKFDTYHKDWLIPAGRLGELLYG